MINPLIPTPVVDKNGRLTTVHKRAARNTNGGFFPEPRSDSPFIVTEVDLGEFGRLINSDNHRDAWTKMPRVDQGVLGRVLEVAGRDSRWWQAISRDLNLILTARKSAPYIEARMRRIIAVAPLMNELNMLDKHPFSEMNKIMNATFVMQARFHEDNGIGMAEEWDDNSDIKARGCIIAMASCPDYLLANDFGRTTFSEADAVWLGTHSEALAPLMPLISERGVYTRGGIEPLLRSSSPALTEGIL